MRILIITFVLVSLIYSSPKEFCESIMTNQNKTNYGFQKTDDINAIETGGGLPVSILSLDKITEYTGDDSTATILTPTIETLTPVIYNGTIKCFIKSDECNGMVKPVSIGYAPLAEKLNAVAAQYGIDNVVLVKYEAKRTYLFYIKNGPKDNLTIIDFLNFIGLAKSMESQSTVSDVKERLGIK